MTNKGPRCDRESGAFSTPVLDTSICSICLNPLGKSAGDITSGNAEAGQIVSFRTHPFNLSSPAFP